MIVVAGGAGQHLFAEAEHRMDASGNLQIDSNDTGNETIQIPLAASVPIGGVNLLTNGGNSEAQSKFRDMMVKELKVVADVFRSRALRTEIAAASCSAAEPA